MPALGHSVIPVGLGDTGTIWINLWVSEVLGFGPDLQKSVRVHSGRIQRQLGARIFVLCNLSALPVLPFQLRLELCHVSPHFPFDFTAHGAVCTRLVGRDVSRLQIKGKELAPENAVAVVAPTETFIRCN